MLLSAVCRTRSIIVSLRRLRLPRLSLRSQPFHRQVSHHAERDGTVVDVELRLDRNDGVEQAGEVVVVGDKPARFRLSLLHAVEQRYEGLLFHRQKGQVDLLVLRRRDADRRRVDLGDAREVLLGEP